MDDPVYTLTIDGTPMPLGADDVIDFFSQYGVVLPHSKIVGLYMVWKNASDIDDDRWPHKAHINIYPDKFWGSGRYNMCIWNPHSRCHEGYDSDLTEIVKLWLKILEGGDG